MAKLPSYMIGGIKSKFCVTKADGTSRAPDAHYFVLRYDKDPHARVALAAYATSIADWNPDLAADIRESLANTAKRFRAKMVTLMTDGEAVLDPAEMMKEA